MSDLTQLRSGAIAIAQLSLRWTDSRPCTAACPAVRGSCKGCVAVLPSHGDRCCTAEKLGREAAAAELETAKPHRKAARTPRFPLLKSAVV